MKEFRVIPRKKHPAAPFHRVNHLKELANNLSIQSFSLVVLALSVPVVGTSLLGGCKNSSEKTPAPPLAVSSIAEVAKFAPVAALHAFPSTSSATVEAPKPPGPCPPEMVLIPAEKPYCIDRWEAVIEDKKTGKRLSPYYSPTPKYAERIHKRWLAKRNKVGNLSARATPLPPLPAWQLSENVVPMAVSRPGEIPHGYLSGEVAQLVCENANKRLCTRAEWIKACRGAANQPFPYGEQYEQGTCNIFRPVHPGAVLHNDVTTGHLDPRLNLVEDKQGTLVRLTGTTKTCASRWGNDAVYDMVGNLDEWVDDEDGVFVGGFFSRGKKDGCASVVKNHPKYYWDYSLGVRCCRAVSTQ
ncbi:MAG: hypothetical protein CSA75_00920 [Sorangium cellulosum]|nr:MAG: hypothetical protein CSA75_00920 [Sorangium cellulosum]